jgi:hypothetical protein
MGVVVNVPTEAVANKLLNLFIKAIFKGIVAVYLWFYRIFIFYCAASDSLDLLIIYASLNSKIIQQTTYFATHRRIKIRFYPTADLDDVSRGSYSKGRSRLSNLMFSNTRQLRMNRRNNEQLKNKNGLVELLIAMLLALFTCDVIK